jgi:hypothetical protein
LPLPPSFSKQQAESNKPEQISGQHKPNRVEGQIIEHLWRRSANRQIEKPCSVIEKIKGGLNRVRPETAGWRDRV